MNILYLINYAGKGGTEKYIKLLSNYFKKKGNKIFFIYNIKGKLTEDMKKLNIDIYRLKMNNPFDIKAAIKLSRLCKKNNIDIIHTQFPRENYIAILSKIFYKKVKIINTVHLNINNNFFWKFTNKIMTKRNEHIIAVCNSVKDLLIKNNYPKEKIKVIFNGVKYEENLPIIEKYIRKEFNIKEEEFVFLSITRFSEEKGIFYLLKAIKELKNITQKNFKVIFLGDGYLLKEAKDYVLKNKLENHIIFPGYRTDTLNFITESEVFINSSKSEALSFAILEALSMEKPVIVTKVGGNVDIVKNNSSYGILVEYNNIKNLSYSMKNILEDNNLYNFMKSNTREIIKNKFNLDNILEETSKLYN